MLNIMPVEGWIIWAGVWLALLIAIWCDDEYPKGRP